MWPWLAKRIARASVEPVRKVVPYQVPVVYVPYGRA
jgi:hypothetical protein